MYKINEEYLLSEGNKDKGKVIIQNIVSKKNIKTKKRIHKMNNKYAIVNFIK